MYDIYTNESVCNFQASFDNLFSTAKGEILFVLRRNVKQP